MIASLDSTLDLKTHDPEIELGASARQEVGRSTNHWVWHWKSLGWVLGVITLTASLGGLGCRWWRFAQSHITTDNAFVAGNIHSISSRVAGTVAEVLVNDNQRVLTGTALLKLDTRDFDLRVQQSRNQLVQTTAQIAQAEAQLQQGRAQSVQAEAKAAKAVAELQRARLDHERAQRLAEDGRFAAISKQEFDATMTAREVAQAAARGAQAELESNEALVRSAQAAYAVAQAQRRNAEVSLQDAELQLSYAIVPAPVTGTIGRKSVETGQRVQPGQALVAVVGDEKWVVANFKETQLARMRAGLPVSVRIDAIPGRVFPGRVESFSPASGAQFALLPPDNATGNFTKIVQRVPVKVVFDPAGICGFESKIAAGLSAIVEVDL